MGFLDIFKKKSNEIYMQEIYKQQQQQIDQLNERIKELNNDKQVLRQEKTELNFKLQDLTDRFIKLSKEVSSRPIDLEKPTQLSPKEEEIYKIYNDRNIDNWEDLVKLTNIKLESLRVYVSRIRSKGHEFILKK